MSTIINSMFAGVVAVGTIGALSISDTSHEVPDDSVTPGAVASTNFEEVCSRKNGLTYSQSHRETPQELKREIRQRDGCNPRDSEVDHRVPLSLGGADKKENLWCQPGTGTWNYHDKDKLEVYMWTATCKDRQYDLPSAQKVFLGDWIKSYCEVFVDGRCK